MQKADITAQVVGTTCGQWCRGQRSLWIGNVPVEVEVQPEGHHWSGQFPPSIKVMLGSEWQDIEPPPLDGEVPWVGTYAPRREDGLKQQQIVAALDRLQEYACDWVARKRG